VPHLLDVEQLRMQRPVVQEEMEIVDTLLRLSQFHAISHVSAVSFQLRSSESRIIARVPQTRYDILVPYLLVHRKSRQRMGIRRFQKSRDEPRPML
jgi:hypothetical protein